MTPKIVREYLRLGKVPERKMAGHGSYWRQAWSSGSAEDRMNGSLGNNI